MFAVSSTNLLDQRIAFENQFEGLSTIEFNYDDDVTRAKIIEIMSADLDEADGSFLFRLNRLDPYWLIYDFQEFPSVNWKLSNLDNFKTDKPVRYQQQMDALAGVLEQ